MKIINELRKTIDHARKGKESFLVHEKCTGKENGLGSMLKTKIRISEECKTLVQTGDVVFMVRNALRAGDWAAAEEHLNGW